jgi:hypothetical protein
MHATNTAHSANPATNCDMLVVEERRLGKPGPCKACKEMSAAVACTVGLYLTAVDKFQHLEVRPKLHSIL